MRRPVIFAAISAVLLSGCFHDEDEAEDTEVPVRGLKTVLITAQEDSIVRRFPSVLQPSELTSVAFEIGGKLDLLELNVGQRVEQGELLATLDDTALRIQIDSAAAAVEQARVSAENAADTLARQEELFSRGTVTKVTVDDARTNAVSLQQTLVQAEKSLATAQDNLENAELHAPFSGIISSVETQSFSTVASGAPIATMYRADDFEVSFTVNYDTVSRTTVGKQAVVRLADAPDRELKGVVTELGARADTVSSFPVIVRVQDPPEDIKAGMAVEVVFEFQVPSATGFTLPIAAVFVEGTLDDQRPEAGQPAEVSVYVYNPDSSTVVKRQVVVAGVRENEVLILSGLSEGERVASAGVSFLTDGQKVVLLED